MDDEVLYWTCPYCGANLDIDEKCDCREEKQSTTITKLSEGKDNDNKFE